MEEIPSPRFDTSARRRSSVQSGVVSKRNRESVQEPGARSPHIQMLFERPNPSVRGTAARAPTALPPREEGEKESTLSRTAVTLLIQGAIVAAVLMLGERAAAHQKSGQGASALHVASITLDYPLDGSIFPPEITPPTFIWRDAAENVTHWRIDIAFADGSAGMHVESAGERLAIGEIDQRCVSSTNELPKLTPEQAAAHTWIPEAGVWEAIKKHSVAGVATVTVSGFSKQDARHAMSSGRVTIFTSRDPVGAPIFYRDVPLMPSETEKGIIKPLAPGAIPLIQWRLRDIGKPESHIVLKDMHTCANCHSFSRDGKTMGMDMDGPANDKGLYAIVAVKPQMTINTSDMITWDPSHDRQVGLNRVGFMSQVSPDGEYVVTTVNTAERSTQSNYYVVNFKDYRFLQVFYPTRGILAWYSRATGEREPLPGADDPRYVQTDGVWSPDGSYLVFARAEARDPYPPGGKMAAYANDPIELPIQYDLYRVPFNGGQGGKAEAIVGASGNGMSNTFPKVSPDGRWIVFVKCHNAQLMRPDSQLYVVPARGGQARRMRCNLPLMNSWHSFSPNGRWMVFSSKSRSPYTQMYITHLDEEGNDSPAILIENSTAANRAVNLPEFVNISQDGMLAISTPAVDMYRKFDDAVELGDKGQYDAAIIEWRELVSTNPDDARIHNNLGTALTRGGRPAEAIPEFEKALALNPQYHKVYGNLGGALLAAGRSAEAILAFEKSLQYDSQSADLHYPLALALTSEGRIDEAKAEFKKSLEIDPNNATVHFALGAALASKGDWDAAITEYREALRLSPRNGLTHANLGLALGSKGDWEGAIAEEREALRLDPNDEAVHVYLGAMLGQKGDYASAIGEYHEALRLNPNDEAAHLNLGLALGNKGNWDSAISEEREALRLDPDDGTVHVYLGAMLEQKGDHDSAITEYREALRLNSSNDLAHYNLGVALEQKGDRRGALQEYRAAYELNPQTPSYRQAYERMSRQDKP
jgi:Flp pilus assembly protein TadD/Tol biopolymer transport system component